MAMKCPFRTIRKVRYISYVTNATKQNTSDYDEITEFAECLGTECPHWGTIEYTVYGAVPGCRKAKKEG